MEAVTLDYYVVHRESFWMGMQYAKASWLNNDIPAEKPGFPLEFPEAMVEENMDEYVVSYGYKTHEGPYPHLRYVVLVERRE